MGNTFDPFGEISNILNWASSGAKFGLKAGRAWRANRARKLLSAEFGPDVAEAVATAIMRGIDPTPILERARRRNEEAAERQRLLTNPPNLYGSARWADKSDLAPFLKDRHAFDSPSSLLLGTYAGDDSDDEEPRFVHWDGAGHLLTVAATRSGKSVTTIIPNLLRYRGSAVVLDPKGELYEATSKWRAENVGPVYRIAPFDHRSTYPRHTFNPMSRVRNQAEARTLAMQLFPPDPNASDFFVDDAVGVMTAIILHVLDVAPVDRRHLATVRKMAALPLPKFTAMLKDMEKSRIDAVREAAHHVLAKNRERGLPTLLDTLYTKLAMWSDEDIQASLRTSEVAFEALKDTPATVYIDIDFTLMEPYAPWLRVVLLAALDAMVRNRNVPPVPVLFVLDEFAQLGRFPEFRNAIRTHAGLGVRLWFFLQDIAAIEASYPNGGWRPFFNCEVKQFFGVNDPDTADLVGRYLGTTTKAVITTNVSTNSSSQQDGVFGDGGSIGNTVSSGEAIQFVGKPLMTADEVMGMLGAWHDDWRWGALKIDGPPAIQTRLVPWMQSKTCRERIGSPSPHAVGNDGN